MSRKAVLALALAASAAVAATLGVTGAIGKTGSAALTPLPSASCGPVFYNGTGSPKFLIASDLPLQGAGRSQNLAMQKAIQYVLGLSKFRAGKYSIAYQGCDDSTAQTGAWDSAKCSANGRAYAANKAVIGVLGTFNSGCAKLIVPILNRAPGGQVAMLSSANTNVGLTHNAPWNNPGEPGIYYPTGVRNYARVAASDDYQGPAMVTLFQKFTKVKNVYILNDTQTFGKGVAQAFQQRAQKLGLKVLGFESWDPKATSYEAIGERIKNTGAQSVYLGGIVCNNGVKLLKDLRSVLGTKPVFGGPDGWTPYEATLKAGSAAQKMYVSYAGLPLENINKTKTGHAFIKSFSKYLKLPKGQLPPPYAVYQAQAAQVMLTAIGKSNGTRGSVTKALFKVRVKNGIMGSFHFDKNGDILPFKAISFDQLRGNNGVFVFSVILKVGK